MSKEEFPPLLPAGIHAVSISDAHSVTVGQFGMSQTRVAIWAGLIEVIKKLSSLHIRGELLIDGSFVTHKIDPDDIDCVLRISGLWLDTASDRQKHIIKWFVDSSRKNDHSCDTYAVVEWPMGHPRHAEGTKMLAYWLDWFGTSRSGRPKGLYGIQLPIHPPAKMNFDHNSHNPWHDITVSGPYELRSPHDIRSKNN